MKRFIALLIAALMLLSLCACGKAPENLSIEYDGDSVKKLEFELDRDYDEDERTLTAVLEPKGAKGEIEWESSDKSVVKVKDNGDGTCVLTFKGEGDAKITATCGELEAKVKITVSGSDAAPAPAAEAPAAEAAAPAAEAAAPADFDYSKFSVAILLPTNKLVRWERDGNALADGFAQLGCDVTVYYADNDAAQQNDELMVAIGEKVDLIIVAAVSADSLASALELATCPVIAYDRVLYAPGAEYYVGFNNYKTGALQAEYIAEQLGLSGGAAGPYNMEIVCGDPEDLNARMFYDGAMEVLKPYMAAGKLNVPSGEIEFEQTGTMWWSPDAAAERFVRLLDTVYETEELHAVLCSNDSTASGVIPVIEAYGIAWPVVTGQDADEANLKYIVDGTQGMTVFKDPKDEVDAAIVLGKYLLQGAKVDGSICGSFAVETVFDTSTYSNGTSNYKSFLLTPRVIDISNLDYLVDAGWYAWDANHIYLKPAF